MRTFIILLGLTAIALCDESSPTTSTATSTDGTGTTASGQTTTANTNEVTTTTTVESTTSGAAGEAIPATMTLINLALLTGAAVTLRY
ncbi:unnamed protein product [Toxocara canis]|uniref:Secreted protein n=1 Tax=Toxocara canis TaxID=6265 RepID=A0A183V019_TOXCA|nr:unnamed protein product [Toxocara canis]